MKKIMLVIMMMIMFFAIVTYQVQAVELNGENWFLMTHGEKVSYLIGYYAGAVVAYMVAVEYGYMEFETVELLFDAYEEQEVEGEDRIVLHFAPIIAPIKAAFLPLMKKLNDPMHKIFTQIKKKGYSVLFDDTGSIGKRYRRQDEIGTPLCFTYDFDSEKDNTVTVRDRDTMKQERIAIDQIEPYLIALLTK